MARARRVRTPATCSSSRRVADGATAVVGGPGRPEGLETGYYVKPTVFTNVTNDMEMKGGAQAMTMKAKVTGTRLGECPK